MGNMADAGKDHRLDGAAANFLRDLDLAQRAVLVVLALDDERGDGNRRELRR